MAAPIERRLPEYKQTTLERERIRTVGLLKVGEAIIRGAGPDDLEGIRTYYTDNAAAFVPPTPERAGKIFDRDVVIAHRFDNAGVARRTLVNGEPRTDRVFLGDLVAETRGRILTIDAALSGAPAPTAESFRNGRR